MGLLGYKDLLDVLAGADKRPPWVFRDGRIPKSATQDAPVCVIADAIVCLQALARAGPAPIAAWDGLLEYIERALFDNCLRSMFGDERVREQRPPTVLVFDREAHVPRAKYATHCKRQRGTGSSSSTGSGSCAETFRLAAHAAPPADWPASLWTSRTAGRNGVYLGLAAALVGGRVSTLTEWGVVLDGIAADDEWMRTPDFDPPPCPLHVCGVRNTPSFLKHGMMQVMPYLWLLQSAPDEVVLLVETRLFDVAPERRSISMSSVRFHCPHMLPCDRRLLRTLLQGDVTPPRRDRFACVRLTFLLHARNRCGEGEVGCAFWARAAHAIWARRPVVYTIDTDALVVLMLAVDQSLREGADPPLAPIAAVRTRTMAAQSFDVLEMVRHARRRSVFGPDDAVPVLALGALLLGSDYTLDCTSAAPACANPYINNAFFLSMFLDPPAAVRGDIARCAETREHRRHHWVVRVDRVEGHPAAPWRIALNERSLLELILTALTDTKHLKKSALPPGSNWSAAGRLFARSRRAALTAGRTRVMARNLFWVLAYWFNAPMLAGARPCELLIDRHGVSVFAWAHAHNSPDGIVPSREEVTAHAAVLKCYPVVDADGRAPVTRFHGSIRPLDIHPSLIGTLRCMARTRKRSASPPPPHSRKRPINEL